jgi:predicted  nucleic acid-binding Zn-ribbon protein
LIGDVRERLARIETSAQHMTAALTAHHDRLTTGDQRFHRLEDRVKSMEDEGRRAIEDLTKVKELPKRLETLEAKQRAWKDVAQYAAAGLVLLLALLGKISMPDALKIFGKAFGIG